VPFFPSSVPGDPFPNRPSKFCPPPLDQTIDHFRGGPWPAAICATMSRQSFSFPTREPVASPRRWFPSSRRLPTILAGTTWSPAYVCGKNSSSGYRCLVRTTCALNQLLMHTPAFRVPTPRTRVAIRPAQLEEVIQARLFQRKSGFKFGKRPRIIFHTRQYYILPVPESSKYPLTPYLNRGL
jgi:hypothetical protein